MGSDSSARVAIVVSPSALEFDALEAAFLRLSSTRVHNALCTVRMALGLWGEVGTEYGARYKTRMPDKNARIDLDILLHARPKLFLQAMCDGYEVSLSLALSIV